MLGSSYWRTGAGLRPYIPPWTFLIDCCWIGTGIGVLLVKDVYCGNCGTCICTCCCWDWTGTGIDICWATWALESCCCGAITATWGGNLIACCCCCCWALVCWTGYCTFFFAGIFDFIFGCVEVIFIGNHGYLWDLYWWILIILVNISCCYNIHLENI